MRRIASVLPLIALFAFSTFAQKGPCTEELVTAESAKSELPTTKDYYLFSGSLEKPVIGEEEISKAMEPVMAKRKNVKHDPNKPDRIVAAPSGDMAYEYGTTHVSFDDSDNGKHRDFTAAYLRVWIADDGSCKVAATMYQPEGKR